MDKILEVMFMGSVMTLWIRYVLVTFKKDWNEFE